LANELDWTPARRPSREPIAGQRVRLEPLEPDLADWIRSEAAAEDPLFFAIVDTGSGEARGVASYLRITPGHGTIEIGHIWLGTGLQRTAAATEAMYLLARRAFDELGNRRLEWKCNADNDRSRRAADRLGFSFEGVFRQHQVIKGENRDSAWYSLLDGRQRRSLAEVREAG
jgi:RimJ/RimL family protein N-acetyltransferase